MNRLRCGRSAIVGVMLLALGHEVANATEPPTYRATVLSASSDDHTFVAAMNADGWTTGYLMSNSGWPRYPQAYVSHADGSILPISVPTPYGSRGLAINDHGVVVGTYDLGEEDGYAQRVFRLDPDGTFTDLGSLGGLRGEVEDMNNRGEIVGQWQEPETGRTRAFRYSDEAGWEILNDTSIYSSWPTDINDRGDVVGNIWRSGHTVTAWHWKDGQVTDLGTLGGAETHAYYVNNEGVVVGDTTLPDGTIQAFRWSAATGMTPLPTLDGVTQSKAFWVTDTGMIGGTQRISYNQYRAVVYSESTGVVDLGMDLGSDWQLPSAMNEAGVAVFHAFPPNDYTFIPYVHSPEFGLHDLNDLVAPELPFRIHEPVSINGCGEIVVASSGGFPDGLGYSFGVLLTPMRPGDLDQDSDVDLADYAILQANFNRTAGAGPQDGDMDGDGDVDSADAASFLGELRAPCR